MSRYQTLHREIFTAIRDMEYAEKFGKVGGEEQMSTETIEEIKKSIAILKNASVYMERISELLHGFDSEETFHRRLAEDLV
jgi:hypothetical protein